MIGHNNIGTLRTWRCEVEADGDSRAVRDQNDTFIGGVLEDARDVRFAWYVRVERVTGVTGWTEFSSPAR